MTSDGQRNTAVEERGGRPERRAQGRKPASRTITLPSTMSVKELAELIHVSPVDTIKQLMRNGIMASMNQVIDYEMATLVTSAFSVRTRQEPEAAAASGPLGKTAQQGDAATLQDRPPVVTILGHVDHGKTTLLDAIRRTRVAAGEVGGITQHIGAYKVEYNDREITFLDTPGHEAFTAIRARGARVTDIAVLVVAADDGVMPQTKEALDHARAAGVSLMVAINKVDRPEADLDRVKRQLAEQSLVLEEWGGDTIAIPVSAMTGEGIDNLLESILLVAEVGELKADPDLPSSGVVIEAKLDRARGPLATVLVQSGTLKVGDNVVAGMVYGRVRAMADDRGQRIKTGGPSDPVEVMGFSVLPEAGDLFMVVPSEKAAKDIVADRQKERQAQRSAVRAMTLEEIYAGVQEGEVKELNLVIKADVQGSVEAVSSALERLENEKVKVRILHAGSGTITDSDVLLASASSAIVIGFNTPTQLGVERLAEREGVEIRNYEIIYRVIEDIEGAMKGILETTSREVVHGHAEVRAIFAMGKRGNIAGCMVTEGRLTRAALVRVRRDGQVIHDGSISSLRHFKEEVNEMAAGFECGVGVAGFRDFHEGDMLETYRRERARA